MTREDIRDLARKKLGETTAAFWTNDEINDYINLGCKDVAYRTKCLRSSTTIASVSCSSSTASAKSNEYTISDSISNFFAITDVYFMQNGTDKVKLIPTSREELDATEPGWRTQIGYTYTTGGTVNYNYSSHPGIPNSYYWDREEDILGLNPPPNDDNEGSGYIQVYYTYDHTDMTSDSDSPTLPTPLHPAVVEYVVATAYETRQWGDRANDSWQKYFSKLNDYKVERGVEREDDTIIMKNYRDI